jgi:hypothetical protein
VEFDGTMRPRVPVLVLDRAPDIESLSNMKPLPEAFLTDYVIGILDSGNSRVPENRKAEWNAIYAQYTQEESKPYIALTPDRLERLLNEFEILGDYEQSLIKYYPYYRQTVLGGV